MAKIDCRTALHMGCFWDRLDHMMLFFVTQVLETHKCRITKGTSHDSSGPKGDERENLYDSLFFF